MKQFFFFKLQNPRCDAVMRRCSILTVKDTCVFIIEARFLKVWEDESCRSLVLGRDRKDKLIVSTADVMVVVSGAGVAAVVDVAGERLFL